VFEQLQRHRTWQQHRVVRLAYVVLRPERLLCADALRDRHATLVRKRSPTVHDYADLEQYVRDRVSDFIALMELAVPETRRDENRTASQHFRRLQRFAGAVRPAAQGSSRFFAHAVHNGGRENRVAPDP
jgi:hypothetical protein